jgi:hypothetical protein
MAKDQTDKMPTTYRGAFKRLETAAHALRPNPAEQVPGAWHGGTPPRPVGNFSDRRTPHTILDFTHPERRRSGVTKI